MVSPYLAIPAGGVGAVGGTVYNLVKNGVGVRSVATSLACGVASLPLIIGSSLIGTIAGASVGHAFGKFWKSPKAPPLE